jgi:diaminohydroxyphosphoribosylaminopyrimidine deaminase/5-amino-6-(5-phosphoribosylamino)uracil reductase
MRTEELIQRTFALALKGHGQTWPNPMVGAVIVKNGKIIGEGYHHRYGGDHAEIDALKNCTESARGATLYVNLEPCCHTNKQTPPCAQRIIAEGISKVVVSNLDPNPSVNGKGLELLQASGIEVTHGVLSDQGEKLNEVFFLTQRKRRPFIHLKMASTLDGKIALHSGESKWITGEASRHHVHQLRALHQAIVVGAETIRKDDPKLTVRLPDFSASQPHRVVITSSGQLPSQAQIFNDEFKDQTHVFRSIEEALEELFKKKIINLFLEGGPNLAASFLTKGLIDRVSLYMNPSFLGSGQSLLENFNLESLAERPKLKDLESRWFGEDLYLTGRLN